MKKPTQTARTIATIVIMFGVAMELLDTTIVNVAIPTMQNGFNATYEHIQWTLIGYTLPFAILLITGGRLGDIFGYRRLFVVGTAGFGAMSLLCGLAPSIGLLVVFRVLQGVFAAMMVPQATSLLQLLYSPTERAKALGLLGAIAALAAALGPVIGGALLHANIGGLGWRVLFFVNIPIALMTVVAGRYLLPAGKSHHPLRVDIPGTILATLALGLLVLPLVQGPDLHWPVWTKAMLASSVPVAAAFVLYELSRAKRGASTLVEISLFRHSTFTKGLLLSAAFQVVLGGILLALTFTLQQGLGYSALKAAMGTFVLILGVIPSVALGGQKLLPIMGRYVITLGSVVMAAGLGITAWALNQYGMGISVWQLVPGLLLSGAGMGLISFPLFAVTLQHVDKGHVGSASGVLEAAQQLGSVFGVVIIGTLFFNHFGQGPGKAFVWALAGSLALLAVVCILSLTLPRTFKTEEELELVR